MVKISVIVPVYNAEKTINKCIKSLINQTFDDYELIVINDGSTDSTKEILEKFIENKKIKIINKDNEGIGKTRNMGIKNSNGEYITFVDSDDYVDEKMLEKYYTFATKNKLDMVTSTYKKVINGKIIEWPGTEYEICNIRENPQLLNLIEYGPCAKLFRRDLIEKYDISFIENKKYEDVPFVCKALLKSETVGYLKESYYYYVINDNSETTTMDQRVFDIFDILKIIVLDFKDEHYIKNELDFFVINKVTNYMLQQRNQKYKQLRNSFIEYGYDFLKENVKDWKFNKYYKKTSFFKRIIKNHKFLLKTYCSCYKLLRKI